jgi:hypothetical protein
MSAGARKRSGCTEANGNEIVVGIPEAALPAHHKAAKQLEQSADDAF